MAPIERPCRDMRRPYASLNPYERARDILAEAFIVRRIGDRQDRGPRIERPLNLVGMQESFADRYPHGRDADPIMALHGYRWMLPFWDAVFCN
ncbi:hypothetical protein [Acidisphaera sp. S103]|uniref:hypothetical protein n=1 Tax=Acidisphaera sp. S103 TaxID=1747223 RepID=UPI00131E6DFD|nr:hypothetical protein [Acidisphaera sp. S103]